MKAFIPLKLKRRIKTFTNKKFKEEDKEQKRINNLPRYTETEISFFKKKIGIVDIASFQFIKKEIFDQEIYKFKTNIEEPYIIDCGANIGLSIIYFKQLFPNARIVAFEPDERVFKVLQNNIEVFNFHNVELIKKACWNEETTLQFYSEGADGGRAANDSDTRGIIEVKATRLISYLNKKVDFLKIDIEGAESEVIHDIKSLLHHVERIFVEFHSFVDKEQMLPEILTILKEAGFHLHISTPGLNSPSPFVKINTYANMDNQLNIYGTR